MTKRNGIRLLVPLALLGLLVAPPLLAEDDDDDDLQGSVELAYRSINVAGSQQKFNEDFDGLQSGYFLSDLTLSWLDSDAKVADYARMHLIGLGGEPYQQSLLRVGRKDSYDLRFTQRKQDYIYDLFGLIGDEDGSQWNTQLKSTDIGLSLYPQENLEVILDYQDIQRVGESVFMKDIARELFLLDTPVDYRQKRYTLGFNLQVDTVDVVFRQTRRDYTNLFENSTEGSLGLDPAGPTQLDFYDWRQRERSSADLTSLTVHAPLGNRVELTVGYHGTLSGDEELSSNVELAGTGIDFNGDPLYFTDAFSDTEVKVNHALIDADVSVYVNDPLSLHFQYRSLDRDLKGTTSAALEGRTCAMTGASCQTDAECDAVTPGDTCELDISSQDTVLNYNIDTATATVEVRPIERLTLVGGYRTIDRKLVRDGFGDTQRDEDFESNGDWALVLGVAWQATDWLKLNADYEDGELDRAFTSTAPFETERTRVRATISPQSDMQIGLTYLDYENRNTAQPRGLWYGTCAATGAVCSTDAQCDAVTPGDTCTISPFDHSTDGTNWSASFWHRAHDHLDYLLRYGEQEIKTSTAVLFDGPGFGGPTAFAMGSTVFDSTNREWSARVNYTWGDAWRAYVRYWYAESDGNNLLLNDNTVPPNNFSNDEVIDQNFQDSELGLVYTFSSGLYLGATLRNFDYDDRNDLLDYDGNAFLLRGGFRF